MDIKKLKDHAFNIPSLGGGGREIRETLIKYVKKIQPNTNIVEIGPWMGSATGYICYALKKYNIPAEYHAFDKWVACEPYIRRAKKYHGIDIRGKDVLYSLFCENIKPFNIDMKKHREDILSINWNKDKKISLYVDDYGVSEKEMNYKMSQFIPAFIPGKTVLIMMDFFFFETHKQEKYFYQREFFKNHEKRFKFLQRAGTKAAIFLFLK